jgi:hypothetical protein
MIKEQTIKVQVYRLRFLRIQIVNSITLKRVSISVLNEIFY